MSFRHVVVYDIDGTLVCTKKYRKFHDTRDWEGWRRAITDEVMENKVTYLKKGIEHLNKSLKTTSTKVCFLTSRHESVRDITETTLFNATGVKPFVMFRNDISPLDDVEYKAKRMEIIYKTASGASNEIHDRTHIHLIDDRSDIVAGVKAAGFSAEVASWSL